MSLWAIIIYLFIYLFICFGFWLFLGAIPAAYGGSQARGLIRAVATGLYHSHSHIDLSCVCDLHHSSQPYQILNPLSNTRNQPATSWFLVGFISAAPRRELLLLFFMAMPKGCGSSQAKDPTCTAVITRATGVTTPDKDQLSHQGTPVSNYSELVSRQPTLQCSEMQSIAGGLPLTISSHLPQEFSGV